MPHTHLYSNRIYNYDSPHSTFHIHHQFSHTRTAILYIIIMILRAPDVSNIPPVLRKMVETSGIRTRSYLYPSAIHTRGDRSFFCIPRNNSNNNSNFILPGQYLGNVFCRLDTQWVVVLVVLQHVRQQRDHVDGKGSALARINHLENMSQLQ